MKNVLNYQSSEYDCGPTTLTNALRFLFERCDIPPELLKAIALYTLDAYNEQGGNRQERHLGHGHAIPGQLV